MSRVKSMLVQSNTQRHTHTHTRGSIVDKHLRCKPQSCKRWKRCQTPSGLCVLVRLCMGVNVWVSVCGCCDCDMCVNVQQTEKVVCTNTVLLWCNTPRCPWVQAHTSHSHNTSCLIAHGKQISTIFSFGTHIHTFHMHACKTIHLKLHAKRGQAAFPLPPTPTFSTCTSAQRFMSNCHVWSHVVRHQAPLPLPPTSFPVWLATPRHLFLPARILPL